MTTAATSQAIIEQAAACQGFGTMQSSAALCLDDAKKLQAEGKFGSAARRAIKSLTYSVGVFDPRYAKAVKQYDAEI